MRQAGTWDHLMQSLHLDKWSPPATKYEETICCYCLVTKLCPALCDPIDCWMPGFHVLHFLPEFAQIHVHWVSDNHLILSHPFLPFYKELKITVYVSSWPKWCTTRYKKKNTQSPTPTFEEQGANTGCQEQKQDMPQHTAPLQGWANHWATPWPKNLPKTLLSDCKALRGTQRTSLRCCFSGWTVHWVAIFSFSGFFFFFLRFYIICLSVC